MDPGPYWFIDTDGKVSGPRAADLIREAIRHGRIRADTLIGTHPTTFAPALEVLGAAAFDPAAPQAPPAEERREPPRPPPRPVPPPARAAPPPVPSKWDTLIGIPAYVLFGLLVAAWFGTAHMLQPRSSDTSFSAYIDSAGYHWRNHLAKPFLIPLAVLTAFSFVLWIKRTQMRTVVRSVHGIVLGLSAFLLGSLLLGLILAAVAGFLINLMHGLAGIH
ncbi:MAG: hypothetical protein HS116_17440 [Planctomycetes bacterium]|nr:hypothetical protein [Planctomycetota bacterium]